MTAKNEGENALAEAREVGTLDALYTTILMSPDVRDARKRLTFDKIGCLLVDKEKEPFENLLLIIIPLSMEKYILSSLIGSLIALVAFGDGIHSLLFLILLSTFVFTGVIVGLNKLFG